MSIIKITVNYRKFLLMQIIAWVKWKVRAKWTLNCAQLHVTCFI